MAAGVELQCLNGVVLKWVIGPPQVRWIVAPPQPRWIVGQVQ